MNRLICAQILHSQLCLHIPIGGVCGKVQANGCCHIDEQNSAADLLDACHIHVSGGDVESTSCIRADQSL